MLLNSVPLNSGVIGSGGPLNFVRFAAAHVVRVVGSAASAVIFSGKAAVACSVEGACHIGVTAYGKASAVVLATGSLFFHVYHTARGSALSTLRVVGGVVGRFATRGTATGVAAVAGSAQANTKQSGGATQVVSVLCRGHVPWEYAPSERTFVLVAGDRTFILPKD